MKRPTSITLEDSLLAELDDLADEQGRSRSNLIEQILQLYIEGTRQVDKAMDRKRPELAKRPGHEHFKKDVIGGGLYRCSCGSIRSQDGVWS